MDDRLSEKPVDQLTRQDFIDHPVWQWVLNEQRENGDESDVRPTDYQQIPLGSDGDFQQYLVSAQVILQDGTSFPACVEVTIRSRHLHFMPLFVFLLDRQLELVASETDRLLSRYTKFPGNRPVQWRLLPLVEGELRVRQGRVRRSLLYIFASCLLGLAQRRLKNKSL